MDEEELIKDIIDDVYSYYEAEHSLQNLMHNHPMFYNGTFTEDNSYQPDEPEPLLTRKEFEEVIANDLKSRWATSVQCLYNYRAKEQKLKSLIFIE